MPIKILLIFIQGVLEGRRNTSDESGNVDDIKGTGSSDIIYITLSIYKEYIILIA